MLSIHRLQSFGGHTCLNAGPLVLVFFFRKTYLTLGLIVIFCVSDIQEEKNLDQFHDHWRKTQIGECDIYIYSAFQDSFRKGVDPCIKLNVAAPLDYKNKCADNAR